MNTEQQENNYKCEWCNEKYAEQFLVCNKCRKKRKDIWWDNYRAISYIIFSVILVGVPTYLIAKPPTEQFIVDNATILFIALGTGVVFAIVAAYYSYRVKKKMKLKDFD